jgi:hypothetical protein
MAKSARRARHSSYLASRETTRPAPSAGWRPPILLLAGAILVVAVIGAVAFAFAVGGGNPGVPSGTQVFAENDHTHVSGTVTYDRVPPAGGAHNATQLNCGVYRQAVPNENAVHSLEHGAVWITYLPTLPADQVAALTRLAVSSYDGPERYIILSPYAGLPTPIVISAWGAQLDVSQASDARLGEFISHFAGGGQGGEQGGECTGGVGTPVE